MKTRRSLSASLPFTTSPSKLPSRKFPRCFGNQFLNWLGKHFGQYHRQSAGGRLVRHWCAIGRARSNSAPHCHLVCGVVKQPWLASGPLGCVLLASQLFAQQTVQSGPKTGGSMLAPLDVALIAPNVPTANAGPLPPPPIKVALSGKALQRFTVARKLAVEYVGGKECSSFLSTHSFEPAKLIEALRAQQPQDGSASSITFLEAGITGAGPDPHGGDSVRTAFTDPEFRTMAISQPLGSDTYYNPQ